MLTQEDVLAPLAKASHVTEPKASRGRGEPPKGMEVGWKGVKNWGGERCQHPAHLLNMPRFCAPTCCLGHGDTFLSRCPSPRSSWSPPSRPSGLTPLPLSEQTPPAPPDPPALSLGLCGFVAGCVALLTALSPAGSLLRAGTGSCSRQRPTRGRHPLSVCWNPGCP